MGVHLPSDDAILARAQELQLVGPGEVMSSRVRSQVAAELQREANKARKEALLPAGPQSLLLSRFTYETPAGRITVDVMLTPNKETPDGKDLPTPV